MPTTPDLTSARGGVFLCPALPHAGGWDALGEEEGHNDPDIDRGTASIVGADGAGVIESLRILYAGPRSGVAAVLVPGRPGL